MTITGFQLAKDSSIHHIVNSIYLLSTRFNVFFFEISAKNYSKELMVYLRVIRSFFFLIIEKFKIFQKNVLNKNLRNTLIQINTIF